MGLISCPHPNCDIIQTSSIFCRWSQHLATMTWIMGGRLSGEIVLTRVHQEGLLGCNKKRHTARSRRTRLQNASLTQHIVLGH